MSNCEARQFKAGRLSDELKQSPPSVGLTGLARRAGVAADE